MSSIRRLRFARVACLGAAICLVGCATGGGVDTDTGPPFSMDANRADARPVPLDTGAGADAPPPPDAGSDAPADAGSDAPADAGGGVCDPPCPAGETCGRDGTCRCGAGSSCAPMGRSCCGGGCVDVQSNPMHCGGCGVACATGQTCSMGRCVAAMCMPSCAPGETCVSGRCMCGSGPACVGGSACCSGSCTRLDTVADCGACGRTCGAREQCCTDVCVDTSRDLNHCGGCGMRCDSMRADGCADGRCRCGSNPACLIGPCLLGMCVLP